MLEVCFVKAQFGLGAPVSQPDSTPEELEPPQ
jgi:hypothetical protein